MGDKESGGFIEMGKPFIKFEKDSFSDYVEEFERTPIEINILKDKTDLEKFTDFLMKPIKYLQNKFQAGTIKESIFSLVTATLGSATITLPYLAARNGIILSSLLIIFGASISYYGSMLLIRGAEKVGSDKYENFAQYGYGRKMAIFTAWCNILTLGGFVCAYIVFVKTLIPHVLIVLGGEGVLPELFTNQETKGKVFWATIYTFFVLTPLCLPRKAGAVRFFSVLGVFGSIYLALGLFFLFLSNRTLVPNILENIKNAKYFNISGEGLIDAIPFVVYAFMYQPTIPIIYRELRAKNYVRMRSVVLGSSISVIFVYLTASIFGYLSLVSSPSKIEILLSKK